MKKLVILAVALSAAVMYSCKKGSGDDNAAPVVKDAGIDSMAYNLGLAQSGGLKQYMMMQLGVDTAYLDDFIKGMKEGANASGKAAEAYNKGLMVGGDIQNMAKGLTMEVYGQDSTQRIGTEKIVEGLVAGLKMKDGAEKDSLIAQANTQFNNKSKEIHDKNVSEKYADWKKKNEDYLAANAKKEGVKTLPSGVQYKVLEPGTGVEGSAINADSVVTCDYVGCLIDSTEFDSSKGEGKQPIQVDMKRPSVIPGWQEILKIIPKGAKREVTIPSAQAYDTRETGPIKPYSTLIFTIEAK